MNSTLKKLLQYGFFLGLGILLIYWQYNKMSASDKDSFVQSIRNTKYVYLIPVILLAITSHVSRAIRWRYLIQPLAHKPKLSNAFATVMIGYLVNSLAPRAGEVAKCGLLGKREKISFEKLIGTILVERAIDLLCYAVIIITTIILQYSNLKALLLSLYNKALTNSAMHPLLKLTIYIVIILGFLFLIRFLLRKYKDNKLLKKISTSIGDVKAGFQSIKQLQEKKAFWIHTTVIWLCYLAQIYVGFKAMDFTSHLGVDAAFAVLTLGTLAMIVTPGGIGSFPIAVAEVLLVYSIAFNNANAFGWIMWGASTSIIVVLGILCFIWFEYTKPKLTT